MLWPLSNFSVLVPFAYGFLKKIFQKESKQSEKKASLAEQRKGGTFHRQTFPSANVSAVDGRIQRPCPGNAWWGFTFLASAEKFGISFFCLFYIISKLVKSQILEKVLIKEKVGMGAASFFIFRSGFPK